MSDFNKTAGELASMDKQNHVSLPHRSKDKPEDGNVKSLRTLAGLYLVNEGYAFFEELQADLSSIKIEGDDADWLWCMLDWQRYILGLWDQQLKKRSRLSERSWGYVKESWEVIIQTTVSMNLSYASPSSINQRQTVKADTGNLAFGKTLCGNSRDNRYESLLAEDEMVLVDSIIRATEEEECTTPFSHEKAFTRLIESTMDDLASTYSTVQFQEQRRSGMTSSKFKEFIEVLDKETKNLIALSPLEEQEEFYMALDRTFRTALLESNVNVRTRIRYLQFYHSLISGWPFSNETLAMGIECVFQKQVQKLFSKLISSSYDSSRPESFPYTMKHLENLLALGADVRGQVKGRQDCSLWVAASSNNWPYFKALFDKGAPYTMDPDFDCSPLQAAAGAENLDIVAFLLGSEQQYLQINVNHADSNGRTALHEAAQKCNESVIKVLLQQPAINVNPRDYTQHTPFLHSVEAETSHPKKYASVKMLLRDKRVDCNVRGFNSANALHLAAMSRDATLKIIIRHVKGINDQDDSGDTPLHYAVKCNSKPNLDILLSHGADPTVSSSIGFTPLLLACEKLHLGPMELLLSLPGSLNSQCPRLTGAHCYTSHPTERHCSPVIVVLLYYGEAGRRKRAHLILALRTILAAKPDLEIRNDDGQSVLNHLIPSVDDDVALELLQAGADVNSQDNDGRTPLHRLMSSDMPRFRQKLELLLKWGADIGLKDKDGQVAVSSNWIWTSREKKLLERMENRRKEEAMVLLQKKIVAKQTKANAKNQKQEATRRIRAQASKNPFSILSVEGTESRETAEELN